MDKSNYAKEIVQDLTTKVNIDLQPIDVITGGDNKIFSLVLINGRETGNDRTAINANMIFQPHIRISSANEEKKIFTSTIRQVEIKEDIELLEMDMLYSQYKCYGQGHGCSVNWGNEGEIETEEPEFVESSFIPEYNLKQMKAAQKSQYLALSL